MKPLLLHVLFSECPVMMQSVNIFHTIGFTPFCSPAAGIEAPDLTSLLEQFEETQGEPSVYCVSVCSCPFLCNPPPPFFFFLLQLKRKERSLPWNCINLWVPQTHQTLQKPSGSYLIFKCQRLNTSLSPLGMTSSSARNRISPQDAKTHQPRPFR